MWDSILKIVLPKRQMIQIKMKSRFWKMFRFGSSLFLNVNPIRSGDSPRNNEKQSARGRYTIADEQEV